MPTHPASPGQRLTTVRPGRWTVASWAEDLLVQVRLAEQGSNAYGEIRVYEVYRNGTSIGSVVGRHVESSVKTGPGNRLRRVIGYPLRWGYQIGRVTPYPESRLEFDTRAAAIAELLRDLD